LLSNANDSVARIGFDFHNTDFGEDGAQRFHVEVAEAQKIRVAGRAYRLAEPDEQHQGSLEHESICVPRARQPIEQSLSGVAREHKVRIDLQLVRMAHEPYLD
jgi:hypothetical protein